MEIGIPREIKVLEGRVALTPIAVKELVINGHQVIIEQNAGLLSGYLDTEYQDAGAILVKSAKELYDRARLIVKVKEPQSSELKYLRADHILFSYLHL
ncbi:MAG: alanine dehydrogenase, partial [Gammaproteobacteria bacterium]|nr:alanine dehydrogenase [Gammaproteobacteria bacterium]